MNAYEAKQAAKKERYEQMASAADRQGAALFNQAKGMASGIPFGQPILVGHHSEKRDRAYRSKIHARHEQAFSAMNKAEHYRQKAASVGKGGISSDDPDAVAKLSSQLEALERKQDHMKKANQVIRKFKTEGEQLEQLQLLGLSESGAYELLHPRTSHQKGYPSYALTNNNANIRRIKKRIESLQVVQEREAVEIVTEGFTYREDKEENRVMFEFDGKPDEATRTTLKRNGFKWSPSRTAWVRQLNPAGIHAGKAVQVALASE